jgi:hypothetical protein
MSSHAGMPHAQNASDVVVVHPRGKVVLKVKYVIGRPNTVVRFLRIGCSAPPVQHASHNGMSNMYVGATLQSASLRPARLSAPIQGREERLMTSMFTIVTFESLGCNS